MIALMGAAGHVGGKVADLLLAQTETVRVFEHRRPLHPLADRGAQVVRGDAGDVESLRALFDGADAALVLLPEDVTDLDFEATRKGIAGALAEALADSAVGHVVAISAVGVDHERIAGPPSGLLDYERRLFDLAGANVLVLRSAFYMDYLLMNLPLIEAQG